MRIAVPITNGVLSPHFGHCEEFALFVVGDDLKITAVEKLTPPPHEPGILPQWLAGLNVKTIIAGGMGGRAQQLFAGNNIKVIVGAPSQEPEALVQAYLGNSLECGENVCDR